MQWKLFMSIASYNTWLRLMFQNFFRFTVLHRIALLYSWNFCLILIIDWIKWLWFSATHSHSEFCCSSSIKMGLSVLANKSSSCFKDECYDGLALCCEVSRESGWLWYSSKRILHYRSCHLIVNCPDTMACRDSRLLYH